MFNRANKINGKIYIGAHKTKKLDDGYMGSGKHLLRSQEKYGLENFEKDILHILDNSEAMFKKEKELVDESFISRKDTYNIKIGGSGGFDHLKDYMGSEAHLKQFAGVNKKGSKAGAIKIKYLTENDPEWVKRRSENLSTGLKKAYANGLEGSFKNKTHSDDTKLRMSLSKKGLFDGKRHPQYGSMWITNGVENKKINKNELIPKGWDKGRNVKGRIQKILKGKDSPQYGKTWVTNGIKNKSIKKQDSIPQGWHKGFTIRNKHIISKDHQYLKGENHPSYGNRWITNGTDNKQLKKNDNIPNGWSLGLTKNFNTNQIIHTGEKHSQYGTIWITDGSQNKKIKKEDIIPKGWMKGRTMKSTTE